MIFHFECGSSVCVTLRICFHSTFLPIPISLFPYISGYAHLALLCFFAFGFYSPRFAIYFDRQSLFMPFWLCWLFYGCNHSRQPPHIALVEGGIGGSAPPGCCHSSAWFHIGVLLVVESGTGEAVSTVASGTAWHFWVCCHFPAFVFKKRLGCQLVFVQSPLQPSPQRQWSRITLEFRL